MNLTVSSLIASAFHLRSMDGYEISFAESSRSELYPRQKTWLLHRPEEKLWPDEVPLGGHEAAIDGWFHSTLGVSAVFDGLSRNFDQRKLDAWSYILIAKTGPLRSPDICAKLTDSQRAMSQHEVVHVRNTGFLSQRHERATIDLEPL